MRSRPWSGTDKRRKLCNGHSQRVRVPVPERSRRRGAGGTGVDAGTDGHQPPDSSATVRMEDTRYTIHSFRVRGASSHSMDGAGARRHARMTASAAAAGVKRSRDTAFIDANALPLSEQCASSYMHRSHGTIEIGPTRGQDRSLGVIRPTNNLQEGY